MPGYHLQALTDDHCHAGHVLELHRQSHLKVLLPERPAFLEVDLSGDPAAAVARAEGDHAA